MRIINIRSLTIENVIRDIASAWDGTISQNWDRYSIDVPKDWGKGEISGYDLNDGLGLLQYDCLFHDDVQLQFRNRPGHPLVMNYCLAGKLEARFENMKYFVSVEQYQSLILVNKGKNGYVVQFRKDNDVRTRSIKIDKKEFCKSFLLDNHPLEPHYKDLFEESEQDSFYQNHMYSVILSHYFDEIDDSPFKGLIRALRVKGIVLQILSEQLNLYKDELKDESEKRILRQYEVSCIYEAAKIIEDELEELGPIPQIAYRVGLNSNKLQDGFKLLYHNTVNGYVQELRMERASYLLHYSDKSISEITEKLGLKSKSYFSKIFKQTYGMAPSYYRRNKHDERAIKKNRDPKSMKK